MIINALNFKKINNNYNTQTIKAELITFKGNPNNFIKKIGYDKKDEIALKSAAYLLEQADTLVSSSLKIKINKAIEAAENTKLELTQAYSPEGLKKIINANKNAINSASSIDPNFAGKFDDNGIFKKIFDSEYITKKMKNFKENYSKSFESVADNIKDLPGTDYISDYIKKNAGDVISNGVEKTNNVLNKLDDNAVPALGVIGPAIGFLKTAKGIITGDARVTIKGTVSVIDNTFFMPIKTLVSSAIAGITGKAGGIIGTAIAPGPGTAIGISTSTAAGYVASMTVWAKARDEIVDLIIDILEAAKRDPGGDGSVPLGYLFRVIFDTLIGGQDVPEPARLEAYKSLGLTKQLYFVKTFQEIKMLNLIKENIHQETLKLERESIRPKQHANSLTLTLENVLEAIIITNPISIVSKLFK